MLSLDKALAILACFEDGGQLGVSEISRRVEIHPNIVSRMLATLERHGYVQQLGERGKFVIGITPLVLANASVAQFPVRRQALPPLQRLADTYGVDGNLGILHEGMALYLAHVSRDPALRAYAFAGKRIPAHCTALGKALLVALPESEVREIVGRRGLESRTPYTITAIDALFADLAAARERGYVVEREEFHVGSGCIGAPVLAADGAPVAAISVSVGIHSLSAEREALLGHAVLDAAYEISQAMT